MPFVSGGELVLLSKCDYTTDTVQFFWVCCAWDSVKGMLQIVEVGARLSELALDYDLFIISLFPSLKGMKKGCSFEHEETSR